MSWQPFHFCPGELNSRSNRASKPVNIQAPWQSRSANPALLREQQSCVVRNRLQCLWGITISLKIMEKGVSGLCNMGSYKGCPRYWTYWGPVESQCKQKLAAGGQALAEEMSLGTNSCSGRTELLKSWNQRFQKIFWRLTHVHTQCSSAENGFSTDRNGEWSVTLAVNGWKQRACPPKVLKCPNIYWYETECPMTLDFGPGLSFGNPVFLIVLGFLIFLYLRKRELRKMV